MAEAPGSRQRALTPDLPVPGAGQHFREDPRCREDPRLTQLASGMRINKVVVFQSESRDGMPYAKAFRRIRYGLRRPDRGLCQRPAKLALLDT